MAKRHMQISRKRLVVERNGAPFGPQRVNYSIEGAIWPFLAVCLQIPLLSLAKTSLSVISKTAGHRAKRSSIWTRKGKSYQVRNQFGYFRTFVFKFSYYQSPETSVSIISEMAGRRAKQRSIWTLKDDFQMSRGIMFRS